MPQLVDLIDGKSLFIFVERLITHILKASLPSPFYFTNNWGKKLFPIVSTNKFEMLLVSYVSFVRLCKHITILSKNICFLSIASISLSYQE